VFFCGTPQMTISKDELKDSDDLLQRNKHFIRIVRAKKDERKRKKNSDTWKQKMMRGKIPELYRETRNSGIISYGKRKKKTRRKDISYVLSTRYSSRKERKRNGKYQLYISDTLTLVYPVI
jgi:hypothetical protein